MLTATAMTFEATTTATTNLTSSAAPQTRSRYLAASGSVNAEMRNCGWVGEFSQLERRAKRNAPRQG